MTKGAETRDRILDRALQLASSDGLEGLTIGRLAGDVGLSKSGLFAHFRSKEELELAVLATATAKFAEVVIRPAFTAPRGEPRVRALFERWVAWERHESIPGGCVFIQLSVELDDRPGAVRDELVIAQRRWLETIAKCAFLAVEVGHFRTDLDTRLFAFQLFGILSSYYHLKRLLRDESAEESARRSFGLLVQWAKAPDAHTA